MWPIFAKGCGQRIDWPHDQLDRTACAVQISPPDQVGLDWLLRKDWNMQLDALEAEIEDFKAWAEAGISEIARLASEELGHPPTSTP